LQVLGQLAVQIQTELRLGFSPPGADLEEGQVSRTPNQRRQSESTKLQALLPECLVVCDLLDGADQGLAHQLDDFAAQICSAIGKPFSNWAALAEEVRKSLKEAEN